MKKNTCLVVTVVFIFLSMLCVITAYSAQLEQDQAQEETDYGFWFERDLTRWQEFRPYYKSVSQVDIFISKRGNPGNLILSISNGSGDILWSSTVPEQAVPRYGWLEIPVTPSIPVTPHSSYRINVSSDSPSPDTENRFAWMGKIISAYTRGTTSVEEHWPDYDFAFRTWSDIAEIGRACFIYNSDTQGASAYSDFLEANGYPTTLITLDNVVETDLSPCAVIIAGSDTAFGYNWGTPEAVAAIASSNKPILGLGYGGAGLFQELDLSINWGNSWLGQQNSIYVVDTGNEIFNEPFAIFVPRTRIIQLYTQTADVGEYAPYLDSSVTLLGREAANADHYPFVKEGNNILWGFSASPEAMTLTGKKLFLNTVFSLASPPPPPLFLSLNIEDAPEGIVVNKLTGDSDGPAHYTRLQIVTKLSSLSPTHRTAIPVVLHVENNLLGAPWHVYVRNSDGGALTAIGYENLGEGSYRATVDLVSPFRFPWKPWYYRRQIVWEFLIPDALSPQDLSITAEVEVPAADPESQGTLRILAPGAPRAIIAANRTLLYDRYFDNEVSALLQRLFTEAQGPPASHSPQGVIYYVDRYDTRAREWDNTAVDYTSENTANVAANAIDDLIEDWVDDATLYFDLYVPFIGWIHIPQARPPYLLLVGNDDVIPFYRYNDPYNKEQNWAVNSVTNPEVRATDHDYFLTDNPYADLGGGTDWQTGDVELWAGRLLGESAADMLSLLEEGVDWNNGRTGGAVMASVAGWELGLEPDDGRAGEIADLVDVTSLLRSKGFSVRNDNNPVAEVQTIDVMAPYEGGDNSWNSHFRSAANNAGGMDIFLIGGHDSYNHAVIPGDDFSPDDTGSDYTRFGTDHPVAMIVGCHGGLPVPDIDIPGGADNSMVYDLIHEGVRAYIGATGFSYGSPGNLHKCTWGERLIQRFFLNLTAPAGSNSMTLGKALAEAKDNFTFGLDSNDALDRKTVTEFNLYGVPWAFIFYHQPVMAAESSRTEQLLPETLPGTVTSKGDDRTYTRTVEFSLPDFEVQHEVQDHEVYDLLRFKGSDTAISPDAPVLPFVKLFSLPLPPEAEIISTGLVETPSESVGKFNIPIAHVEAFSEGGLTYTTSTDIDFPFPEYDQLVQYQRTTDGVDIMLFPIQHNPFTDETWFYQRGAVQVTYSTPTTISITEFNTEKARYLPGEEVNTWCVVTNTGDSPEHLTGVLQITDSLGDVISKQGMADCTVVPGGSCELAPSTWIGSIPDGPYRACINIKTEEGATVAADTADFSVVTGEITRLSVPETLAGGETGTFRVTFVSHSPEAVRGQVFMTIQNGSGMEVAELPPVDIKVAPFSEEEAIFHWIPGALASGPHTAMARVRLYENEYGPVSQSFMVSGGVCTGNLDGDQDMDGYDLSVFAAEYARENCTPPCPADINEDDEVNLKDVEDFAARFGTAGCP